MRCQFKKPDGRLCQYPAEQNSDFCMLHNPNRTAILFIINCDNHKRNTLIKLTKNKANYYIDKGVAIRVDRKLYERYRKNLLTPKKR